MITVSSFAILPVILLSAAFVLCSSTFHRHDERTFGVSWGLFAAAIAMLVVVGAVAGGVL